MGDGPAAHWRRLGERPAERGKAVWREPRSEADQRDMWAEPRALQHDPCLAHGLLYAGPKRTKALGRLQIRRQELRPRAAEKRQTDDIQLGRRKPAPLQALMERLKRRNLLFSQKGEGDVQIARVDRAPDWNMRLRTCKRSVPAFRNGQAHKGPHAYP